MWHHHRWGVAACQRHLSAAQLLGESAHKLCTTSAGGGQAKPAPLCVTLAVECREPRCRAAPMNLLMMLVVAEWYC